MTTIFMIYPSLSMTGNAQASQMPALKYAATLLCWLPDAGLRSAGLRSAALQVAAHGLSRRIRREAEKAVLEFVSARA
jgi:hypothetical protein